MVYVAYASELAHKKQQHDRVIAARRTATDVGRMTAQRYRFEKHKQQIDIAKTLEAEWEEHRRDRLGALESVRSVALISRGYAMRRAADETGAAEETAAAEIAAWDDYGHLVRTRAALGIERTESARRTHSAEGRVKRMKAVRARENARAAAVVRPPPKEEEPLLVAPTPTRVVVLLGPSAAERAMAEQKTNQHAQQEKASQETRRAAEAAQRGKESLQALRSEKDRQAAKAKVLAAARDMADRKVSEVNREPRVADYMEAQARRSHELTMRLHRDFQKCFVRPDAAWHCVWPTRERDKVRYVDHGNTSLDSVSTGETLLDYEPLAADNNNHASAAGMTGDATNDTMSTIHATDA